MQDWLSYRLSDLLLFSEHSYLRQFELYNQWLSPLLWLFYIYGLWVLTAMLRRQQKTLRLLLMVTAVLWLVCAYGYLWQYYSAINWMARYFIALFIIQAILIIWLTIFSSVWRQTEPSTLKVIAGTVLWGGAFIVQPLIEFIAGRELTQYSVFAATPDSLSCLSIAFMVALRLPFIFFIPIALWLLFSMLTYAAMNNWMGLFPAGVLLAYLTFCFNHISLKKTAQ